MSPIDTIDHLDSDSKKRKLRDKLQQAKLHARASAEKQSSISPPCSESSLTPAQMRVWLHEQMFPSTSVYNEPQCVKLNGQVDAEALEKALNAVLARHQVLRTVVKIVDGKPLATYPGTSDDVQGGMLRPLQLNVHDLSALSEVNLQEVLLSDARKPFDLSSELPVRASLYRLSSEESILLVNFHHIVCDRKSIGIFFRELSQIHKALRANESTTLSPLPCQYGHYAVSLDCAAQRADNHPSINHWLEKCDSITTALDLPYSRVQPALPIFDGDRLFVDLSEQLSNEIRAAAKLHNASTFQLITASIAALIFKYTSQNDFALAVPFSRRMNEEHQNLIGFFADTHILPVRIDKDFTVRDVISTVKTELANISKFGDVSMEHVRQAVQAKTKQQTIVAILVNQRDHDDMTSALKLTGVEVSDYPVHNGSAKFELSFTVTNKSDNLRIDVEYNSYLFARETVERLVEHLVHVLEQFAEVESATTLHELAVMTLAERRFLLQDLNNTRTDYPQSTVQEIFERQAAQTPDAPAVVATNITLSYSELNKVSSALSTRLARSLRDGTVIALCVDRSVNIIVGMLGILKTGCAYLPIDSSFPADRINYMVSHAGVSTVVTQRKFSHLFDAGRVSLIFIDETDEAVSGTPRAVGAESNAPASSLPVATADSVAYVTYTSGSTGRPKGVAVPHRGVIRLLFNTNYATFGSDERIMHHSAVTFDLTTFEIWAPLLHGGCCVVHEDPQDLSKLGSAIFNQGITSLWLTASVFNELITRYPLCMKNLRQLLIGGEALSVHHTALGAKHLPNTKLINGYGPTENTTFTTCYSIPAPVDENATSIPIGLPISNTTVFVLDAERRLVATNIAGELYTGGDGLAKMYLNAPVLTSERFVPNPFNENDVLYKTGDRVRMRPNGVLEYLGRNDDQVKIRGFRIELGEIDSVLLQHPNVEQCATVARSTATGRALVSYFRPVAGATVNISELKTFAKSKLAPYMVPNYFVPLGVFPLNPSGKLDKAKLPEPGLTSQDESADQPETFAQAAIAALMQECLGHANIGLDDNFFDMGGHSFLALKFIDAVQKELNIDVPLRALLENPSVRGLADFASKSSDVEGNQFLVRMRKGQSDRRLFWVPGGDGTESTLLMYERLIKNIDEDYEVYGLRASQAQLEMIEKSSVEKIASAYLREVVALQTDGPYYLAGECVGGVLVFEMAHQLQKMGREVGAVILLDCRVPSFKLNAFRRSKWFLNSLKSKCSALMRRQRATDIVSLAKQKLSSDGFEQSKGPNQMSLHREDQRNRTDRNVQRPGQSEINSQRLKDRLWIAYQKTLMRYRPTHIAGTVDLVLNADYLDAELHKEWVGHADQVVIHLAPGTHDSYIRDHAHETARVLNDILGQKRV